MSLSENPPGDTPITPFEERDQSNSVKLLQAEVRFLRILFNIVLVALLALVAGLLVYILHEKKGLSHQIEVMSFSIAEYQRKQEPRLNEFTSKIIAYSKLHTNFAPIIVKYFGATNIPSGLSTTSAIPTTPAPGLGIPAQPRAR